MPSSSLGPRHLAGLLCVLKEEEMASFAYKVGEASGMHQDLHIYVGQVPGQRARAGVLRVRHDELPDLLDALEMAGFEKVRPPASLVAPPHIPLEN